VTLSHHPALQFPGRSRCRLSASRRPVPPLAREACCPSPWGFIPCGRLSRPPTTTAAPCPEGSHPVGHPAVHSCNTCEREGGGPLLPAPPSLGGAGLAAVAQAVRLSVRRVHLAVRRCRQRPSIDRWAWDFKHCSFRHVTRVSPSHGFSVFSPLPALSAGACPLALSGSGKPLTQGSPLNPSHLRWGCCLNYCGAPDAGGSQVQRFVSPRPPGPRKSIGFTQPPFAVPLALRRLSSSLRPQRAWRGAHEALAESVY
jgi:hypothetical protein